MSTVSREAAAEIAVRYARDRHLGWEVAKVLSEDEISSRKPFLFDVPLTNSWIAYLKADHPMMIQSSTIVVIDRASGRVVYGGSAFDEG